MVLESRVPPPSHWCFVEIVARAAVVVVVAAVADVVPKISSSFAPE